MMAGPLLPLDPCQVAVLAEIHGRCFRAGWTARAFAELLSMPGAFGFLAGGDRPNGFILCRAAADEAEVITLAVLPECRRQGIARRLLRVALAGAGDFGVAAMFLEVAADNSAGRELYRTCGFEQVGRRPDYYENGIDALVLKRPILA